ncbi:hypothetical protein C8F04DRAFT_1106113 [Mycena alexandri]|uniref:Uncharacterized protein n=1 Tax=Mycena alexandri TaxID=1745969 RepID=A0AAD6WZ56_9AGAR|nr:hypothetical protein C8F04DRAFT_1106113 [Mycena alexandri]
MTHASFSSFKPIQGPFYTGPRPFELPRRPGLDANPMQGLSLVRTKRDTIQVNMPPTRLKDGTELAVIYHILHRTPSSWPQSSHPGRYKTLPRSSLELSCRIRPLASRSTSDAFIPVPMGSLRTSHGTPSPFLSLFASNTSSASRSTPNALILAFMGSWRTSSNAPSPSFSFAASSPSSASHSDSHPYLYWIVYGTIRSPPHSSFGWRPRVRGWHRGEYQISQSLNIPIFSPVPPPISSSRPAWGRRGRRTISCHTYSE